MKWENFLKFPLKLGRLQQRKITNVVELLVSSDGLEPWIVFDSVRLWSTPSKFGPSLFEGVVSNDLALQAMHKANQARLDQMDKTWEVCSKELVFFFILLWDF